MLYLDPSIDFYFPANETVVGDCREAVGRTSSSPRTRSASPCLTTGRRAKTCRQDFPQKSKVTKECNQYLDCLSSRDVNLTKLCIICIAVIDLYDGEQYSNLSKTHAYSNVRKLNG